MKELYKDIFQSILKKENPLELQRLAAIFEQLSIQAKYEEKTKTFFYEAACLPDFDKQVNPSFFSQKETNWDSSSLLQEIEKEYEKISNTPNDDYTYFHLVYKYLSRVTDVQDDVVSLFDKYRIAKAKENLKNASQYLLVKGDFSGMQKFIYGGIKADDAGNTKGLSKRLRGRSFYISVMADMVAETFAEELGLGIENVIYSGGGHFLLLCDDTDKNKEKISELTANINDFLLNNVGTALSFITGQASCDEKVFDESGNIGEVMMKLNHDLAGKKYKMYQGNLVGIFGMEEEATFGKRGKDIKERKYKAYDDRLGDLLPRIKTIIELTLSKEWDRNKLVEYIKMQEGEEYVACEVLVLNKVLIMTERVDKGYLIKLLGLYSNLVDSVKIIRINANDDFLKDYQAIKVACPSIKVHFGFRYIGNHTPFSEENSKEIAPFSEIIKLNNFDKTNYFEISPYPNTENVKEAFRPWKDSFVKKYDGKNTLSFPKLAVMRLDVDNLGTIFGFGMGEKASLAKTATLSRELHLFFTGYFSVLAKKYDIYITYSGGDDAFVVGSWIGIAHFAKELYHQFKRFVCANNEITFSAGVFLCDEHYPVAKFAFDAEQQEKRAKSCPTKNAITIFDHTLSFPHYDVMLNFAVNMLKHVRTDDEKADKEKIARSMVHRILRIIKSCINNEDKGFSIKMDKLHRQTANLHYLFARHGFGEKEIDLAKANDERAKAITKDIMEIILCHFKDGDYNCLVPNFLIPTHYVTLLTRKAK